MKHACWNFTDDTGFLIAPDPVCSLSDIDTGISNEAAEHLQQTAEALPELIATRKLRGELAKMPRYNLSPLKECEDFRVIERAFQIYSHFANAYVWVDEADPSDHIPSSVAVPLVELSKLVERPPILPYATTSLSNFRRIDPDGDLSVDNLRCIQKLVDIPDESWFHLIHVEIEWHAAGAIAGCKNASEAAVRGDVDAVEHALGMVPTAFDRMISTFKNIGRGCSPDIYYFTLRPYLFGFTDVVYEGVAEFRDQPQSFRGESGAQSTVIPAIRAFLGLQHEKGGLTEHLEIMTNYMPKPHRELLRAIDTGAIREFVIATDQPSLKDAYNACLESMVSFRSLHLNMTNAYVAKKVKNPIGTGGTEFMHWLKQLRDETAKQMV